MKAPALLMDRFTTVEPVRVERFTVSYDAEVDAWALYDGARLVSHFVTRGAALAGRDVEARRARRTP